MRTFEVDGKQYVRINGKSFYLLRGYRLRYDKWVFVQVFGTAPLTKDDLPEKNWELLVTKGREGRVFTAWKPGFFDGSNETRFYVGATEEAGLRLLLEDRLSADRVSLALPLLTAGEHPPTYTAGIDTTKDDGNAGVPAYSIDRPYAFNAWIGNLTKEDA